MNKRENVCMENGIYYFVGYITENGRNYRLLIESIVLCLNK